MSKTSIDTEVLERETFESWHKRQMGGSVNYRRDSNGDYENMDIEVQWWAWLGRAALAAQQEPMTADEEDPTVVIHNSKDGREEFERGERKVS